MGNKYVFTNILGSFLVDNNAKIMDKAKTENDLVKKYKKVDKLDQKQLKKVLASFKNNKYFNNFYLRNIAITKRQIKESINEDNLITQTVSHIAELDKIMNILGKRLREWYGLYCPEFVESIQNQEKFIELILQKDKNTLLKESGYQISMGADLKKEDLASIKEVAIEITEIKKLQDLQTTYLERIMKAYCPNLEAVVGTVLGAKLLSQAGSLKKLAMFPASTIQLLGAEEALFRHLKNKKNRSPKYGLLFQHPLMAKVKKSMQGKVARSLADKASIATRVDYFKGTFKGKALLKEVEDKFL